MKLVQLINRRDYFQSLIKQETPGFFKDCFSRNNLQLIFTSNRLNLTPLFVSITSSAQTFEPGLFYGLFGSVQWSVILKYIFWGKDILKSKSKLCSFTKRRRKRVYSVWQRSISFTGKHFHFSLKTRQCLPQN